MTVYYFEDTNENLLTSNNKTLIKKKENLFMENTGDFHIQLYAVSPAPKRDYHGLTITSTHVIFNSWDISHGPHVYPRRKRNLLKDFLRDRWFRSEVETLFGKHVIDYIERISNDDRSLYSLSETILRKIIGYLAVNDILHLRQTSKIFFELCNTNDIWKIIFIKKEKRAPLKAEFKLSEIVPWHRIMQRKYQEEHDRKDVPEKKKNEPLIRQRCSKTSELLRKDNAAKNSNADFWNRSPSMDKKILVKNCRITEAAVPLINKKEVEDSKNNNTLKPDKLKTESSIKRTPNKSSNAVVKKNINKVVNVLPLKTTNVKPKNNQQNVKENDRLSIKSTCQIGNKKPKQMK